MIRLALIVLLSFGGGLAYAEAKHSVALLPLDTDKRLELYGQPVASEIAKTLRAGGIDVVVVGKNQTTPETATLIVDGTIKEGPKKDAVVINLRVRNRADGTTLESLASKPDATLTTLDKSATELSARLQAIVTKTLATIPLRQDPPPKNPDPPVTNTQPIPKRPMVVAVIASTGAPSTVEPLRLALEREVDTWVVAHDREPKHVDGRQLAARVAAKTVADARSELGIVFEVAAFTVKPGVVPTARARLRVRVAGTSEVVFDRVVVTDTVVGDKGMLGDKLAARVADEILQILRPHMRRSIGGWK